MMTGDMIGDKIPVEVSNRHVHLSSEHVEVLFGKGYELKRVRRLSQPGQFAAEEKVRLVNGDNVIDGVRVLGPERDMTQVEISGTDASVLGIDVPLRLSGDIEGSPGITIEGPEGSVILENGVIMAKRHVHISEEGSRMLGLIDGQTASIRLANGTGIIIDNLVVRVGKDYSLAAHIDVDEWGALDIEGDECSVHNKKVNKVCSAFLLEQSRLSEHAKRH